MIDHVARMLRARTIDINEARDIISEVMVHLEPRDKDRLIKEIYREISRHYHYLDHHHPDIEGRNEYNMEIAKARLHEMTMPVYKFRIEDGKIVNAVMDVGMPIDEPDIEWIDKTAKELDELLEDEKLNFLSEQEMKI